MGFCFVQFFNFYLFLKGLFASIFFSYITKWHRKINNNLDRNKGGVVGFSCNSFHSRAGKAYCTVGEKYQNYSNYKKGNIFCLLIIHHIFHLFLKMNYKQKRTCAGFFTPLCNTKRVFFSRKRYNFFLCCLGKCARILFSNVSWVF